MDTWKDDFDKCDGCNNLVHPEYVVFRGRHYLCYECARKPPDEIYNARVPNLPQLLMRREMGECLQSAKVNTVASSTDGMKLRYKTATDPTFSNFFSKNEIIIFNPPERNDAIENARKIVKLIGIDDGAIVSTTEIWLPPLSDFINNKYYKYFQHLPIYHGKAWASSWLLIRLCPDWRNRRKKECNLGPNDIILRGIPEVDITDLRKTSCIADKSCQADKFQIRLVARNAGVYIEADMFTSSRVALWLTTCTDRYCGPELPRALLVRFKNPVVKETLANAFRNRKDLFERAPNDFAPLKRDCQKRKFYYNTRPHRHIETCKIIRYGGVIEIEVYLGCSNVVVLISNDEGQGSGVNFRDKYLLTILFPSTSYY